MMKAEASDEGFGLFTWGLITLQVEHTSDTMTQSEGTKKIGAPARDRGSGLRQ